MGTDIHMFVERSFSCANGRLYWRRMAEYNIGRNYDLFAILANVRNGRVFAGCDTGDALDYIDTPRGLPDGTWLDDDEVDHSASWLSLKEVIEFDYDQVAIKRGYVTPSEYKIWKAEGRPYSWWGMTTADIISNDEMELFLSGGLTIEDNFGPYTQVEWKESYRELVGEDWFDFIESVKALGPIDDMRLVFYFDS